MLIGLSTGEGTVGREFEMGAAAWLSTYKCPELWEVRRMQVLYVILFSLSNYVVLYNGASL